MGCSRRRPSTLVKILVDAVDRDAGTITRGGRAPGDRVVHDLEVGVIEGSEAIGSLRERLRSR